MTPEEGRDRLSRRNTFALDPGVVLQEVLPGGATATLARKPRR